MPTADESLQEARAADIDLTRVVFVKRSEWEQSTDEEGEWESEYLARSF